MNSKDYKSLLRKCSAVIRNQGVTDPLDVESIAHEAMLCEKSKGYELRKSKQMAIDFLRKRRPEIGIYLDEQIETDHGQLVAYEVIACDDTNERETAIQEAQRQLIYTLADGSDERTTLIVQTFLDIDKPTINNVAKFLGIHHQVVSRSIRKLSMKFSEGKFGNLADYLTA